MTFSRRSATERSACVAVTAGPERPVLVVADRIAVGGNAGAVIGDVTQSVVGCLPRVTIMICPERWVTRATSQSHRRVLKYRPTASPLSTSSVASLVPMPAAKDDDRIPRDACVASGSLARPPSTRSGRSLEQGR